MTTNLLREAPKTKNEKIATELSDLITKRQIEMISAILEQRAYLVILEMLNLMEKK